jgi:hypothetical protein
MTLKIINSGVYKVIFNLYFLFFNNGIQILKIINLKLEITTMND